MKAQFRLCKNQKQLDKLKPTHLGTRSGFSFYECPIHGDETTMLVKLGAWFYTDIWELEDAADAVCDGVEFPL